MYHCPRFYGDQWRPRGRGHRPHAGYQHRPHAGYQHRPRAYFNFNTLTNPTNKSNEEYWCETCDRGFPSLDALEIHKQQHQKCNIDGCQFVAHPKVITKHIQMQHSSGLYKKISKLDNPEEIQKWREERKKKYPTRVNIDKKVAEIKEKVERGEKMALKQKNMHDGYKSTPYSQNTDQGRGRKRKHGFDRKKQNNIAYYNKSKVNLQHTEITNNRCKPPLKKVPNVPSVIEKNNLKPFCGISSIVMNDNEVSDINETLDDNSTLIEDDCYERPIDCKEKTIVQEPSICGALTLLMCDYGSSDDEANEKENTIHSNAKTEEKIEIETNSNHINHVQSVNVENNEKSGSNLQNKNLQENLADTVKIKCSDNVIENSDDDSGPEEIKSVNNVVELEIPQELNSKIKEAPKHVKRPVMPKNDYRPKYRHKVPSTLLHKLLHKEIRHERNIVLQCIRYIKKLNYFEKTVE